MVWISCSAANPKRDVFAAEPHEMRISLRDVGILPLLVSLPFMFYPKALAGDTQLWVLTGATIAFLTFRTDRFLNRRDGVLIVLAFLCILAYASRNTYGYELIRHTYTYVAFLVFWVVCQREKGEYFPLAVKATVLVWFLVGLYQFLALKFGYQIEFVGRYVEGRGGVPSLTAEPSYYGGISVLQLMYLLDDRNGKKNKIYAVLAFASVMMSGSVLAMILLLFPLWKLPLNIRIVGLLLLAELILLDYSYLSFGFVSRLMDLTSRGTGIDMLLLDYSLNLRAGHIYFTLVENLFPSLFLIGPIDFMEEYNSFAVSSGVLVQTGSNYILPAIGEMVYGSGFLAVMLLMFFLKRAQETCATRKEKVAKIVFILVCMLNPISIANIFLIIYATQKGKAGNESYCYRRYGPGWLLYGPAAIRQRIRSIGPDH